MKKIAVIIVMFLTSTLIFSQNDYIVKTNETKKKSSDKTPLTNEEKFIKDNFPFIPIPDLQRGMEFLAIKKNYYYPEKTEYIVLQIDSVKESLTKKHKWEGIAATVCFSKKDDNFFFCEYIITKSFEEIRNRNISNLESLSTIISNQNSYDFIYLGDIQKARELLLNKELYILTDEWRSDAGGGFKTHKKFTPVTITQIGASDEVNFPIKIIFKDKTDEEYYIMTSFSGTNQPVKPIETWGCWSNFSKVFSFKNPRLKYPKISTQTWTLITQGKVRVGMSKEACRLSWGEPESINKTTGSYGTHEQWVYGSSSYLYFDNGRLTSIQN